MSQGWSKIFNRINWLNRPSTNTPLNATNLNAGDSAIDKLDDRIITLDTVKADMQVVNGMVTDVSLNESNGVLTITYKNGSTKVYDTNLEKIAINFTYDYSTQRLVLTLSDGSKQYVDMSALITQYEFKDSTTIAFSVDSTGKVSASVKNGSITEAMLETGYLAKITAQATKAESMANSATTSSNSAYDNAKLSQSYAIGGSGIREGEDKDNAMYYYEQAKKTDVGQIRSEVAELNSNLVQLETSDIAGGKNLLKESTFYITNESKSITDYDMPVGTYTISFYSNVGGVVDFFGLQDNSIIGGGGCAITPSGRSTKTFTVNTPSKLMCYANVSTTITDIQIEEGTQATTYEPYIPSVKMLADENAQQNTETIDLKMLGWTVPSECPVQNEVNGSQFIQKVGRVDLDGLTFTYIDNSRFQASVNYKGSGSSGIQSNIYCSKYLNKSYNDVYNNTIDKSIGLNGGGNILIVFDTTYSDATAFKNAMKGVYLYYELATPITMTIDGNEAVTQIKNDLSNKSPKILFKTIWANDKITGVPTPQSNYLLDDSINWWSDVNIIGITVVDCLSTMHGQLAKFDGRVYVDTSNGQLRLLFNSWDYTDKPNQLRIDVAYIQK